MVTNESFRVLPIVSSIFLVELEYRYGKSVHILRLSTNQAIFRCLHMSGTADQSDHVPSTGTIDNWTVQYLGNTASGVGFGTKPAIFTQPKVYDAETKSL